MSEIYRPHISVLLEECLQGIAIGAQGIQEPLFADLTFGAGGHSTAMLERFPHCRLIAFDQDPQAIKNGQELIAARG